MPDHDHYPLDGKLHDDCPMCAEIRVRLERAERDRMAERHSAALERHAARSRLGRDVLAAQRQT